MRILCRAAICLFVFCNIASSLCALEIGDLLYLTQPVIIEMPNGAINLPVGTPVRLVWYNGATFRVTHDGIIMIDLDRSVMTTEQPQRETSKPHQTGENADDFMRATKLRIETLTVEVSNLKAKKRQLESVLSRQHTWREGISLPFEEYQATKRLLTAKEDELRELIQQQRKAEEASKGE
jgi:hypothetical protein